MCHKGVRYFFLCVVVFFSVVYIYIDVTVDYPFFEGHRLGEWYLVNTSGCHMLTLTSDGRDWMNFWRPLRIDYCKSNLAISSFSSLDINYLRTQVVKHQISSKLWDDNLKNFKCEYHALERNTDHDNRYLYSREFPFLEDGNLTIEPRADIIRAECRLNGAIVYNGVHFYANPPDEGRQISLGLPPFRPDSDPNSLSVMVVCLDSMSSIHFFRSMARTANFLFSLPHVKLQGFNRVGNDTFDSLMPLLTGLSGPEVRELCMKGKDLDDCPFLWKAFQKAGYETALGEDTMDKSLFAELGFGEQPTDYYLRSAMIEMWLKTRKDSFYGTHCNEKDTYASVLKKFLLGLLPHHKRRRFFSFLRWTQGIDHLFNFARRLDAPLMEMFREVAEMGVLMNTLLLVVSDHGLKVDEFSESVQGQVEVNLPLAAIFYPPWLEDRFPVAINNLRANNHRLITAYDLHTTLLGLRNLVSLEDDRIAERTIALESLGANLSRGLDLFLPVPMIRDCPLAQIPLEFCLCQRLTRISTEDGIVHRAARLIVRSINRLLYQHQPPCQPLHLKSVILAEKLRRTSDDLHSRLKVRLVVFPGGGQFEGAVKYTSQRLALNGPIQRVNDYRNQSFCIENYLIEEYCFCNK
ncbi:hypothetical protein KR067_003682 [Drosophila pandora]|nr:hypothetical protein KR067_003682 [Drosophila pandora]